MKIIQKSIFGIIFIFLGFSCKNENPKLGHNVENKQQVLIELAKQTGINFPEDTKVLSVEYADKDRDVVSDRLRCNVCTSSLIVFPSSWKKYAMGFEDIKGSFKKSMKIDSSDEIEDVYLYSWSGDYSFDYWWVSTKKRIIST